MMCQRSSPSQIPSSPMSPDTPRHHFFSPAGSFIASLVYQRKTGELAIYSVYSSMIIFIIDTEKSVTLKTAELVNVLCVNGLIGLHIRPLDSL